MKIQKIGWMVLACLLALFAGAVLVSAAVYSPDYLLRVLKNGESKITDHLFFPARTILKSTRPYAYESSLLEGLPSEQITYLSGGKTKTEQLETLLSQNGTTSCIVIQNDRVAYEAYWNGYGRDSIETSFSSVKSIDSLLIGIAIAEGYIGGVEDRICRYLPELLGTPFADITIEQLLTMRSRIAYREGFLWLTDDAKTYYMPDLRALALDHLREDPDYAGKFHYNNYHPLLLGLILERATGQRVSDYFQQKIWQTIGAEYDASWSLDSIESGFEKMESGLNFRSIDFAKIGSMLLHEGTWNGNRIVDRSWILTSTVSPEPLRAADCDSKFLSGIEVGYRYMWYSQKNDSGGYDYFAAGKFGQYLYVSPENNTVIVRTGYSTGRVDWWPEVFRQMAQAAQEQSTNKTLQAGECAS